MMQFLPTRQLQHCAYRRSKGAQNLMAQVYSLARRSPALHRDVTDSLASQWEVWQGGGGEAAWVHMPPHPCASK